MIKLENLENLEKLTITDNEVCNAHLLKYFIIYRLNNLKYFNNKAVKEIEIDMSRNIFQYFDEVISIKEKNEIQKEENLNNNENKNNTDNIDDIEDNSEICEINNYEKKIEFFNYAKFNLSVCMEEIIKDEDDKDDV